LGPLRRGFLHRQCRLGLFVILLLCIEDGLRLAGGGRQLQSRGSTGILGLLLLVGVGFGFGDLCRPLRGDHLVLGRHLGFRQVWQHRLDVAGRAGGVIGVSGRRFFVVHGAQPKSVYRRRTELEKCAARLDTRLPVRQKRS
jgi:hypothetical protein